MKQFIDLFCGGGMGARGAVSAGWTPRLAVDLWDVACSTYKANFPATIVINDRVERINPLDYCSPGDIELLIASPECTNHSVAKGSATRDEKSRETALHTVHWIEMLKPRWFIMENVKEMQYWSRYPELVKRLESAGYKLRIQVINAADHGAPQARIRLFLIGGQGLLPPEIVTPKNVNRKVIHDILDPEGTWPMRPVFIEGRAETTRRRVRHAIRKLGKEAEFLLVYYGSGGNKSWQTLDQPLRTVTTLDRFALVRKMRGKWCMRMLQPSELARAMALPAEHMLPVGSRREKVKVCGNGVCAAVMESIVTQLDACWQAYESFPETPQFLAAESRITEPVAV